jgi:hypothetical protein
MEYPLFRRTIDDIVRDHINGYVSEDSHLLTSTKKILQNKFVNKKQIMKLDEVMTGNYDAVLSMLRHLVGKHFLAIEVNKSSKASSLELSDGAVVDVANEEEPQHPEDAEISEVKKPSGGKSIINRLKDLPRSVSAGLLVPKKAREGGSIRYEAKGKVRVTSADISAWRKVG